LHVIAKKMRTIATGVMEQDTLHGTVHTHQMNHYVITATKWAILHVIAQNQTRHVTSVANQDTSARNVIWMIEMTELNNAAPLLEGMVALEVVWDDVTSQSATLATEWVTSPVTALRSLTTESVTSVTDQGI